MYRVYIYLYIYIYISINNIYLYTLIEEKVRTKCIYEISAIFTMLFWFRFESYFFLLIRSRFLIWLSACKQQTFCCKSHIHFSIFKNCLQGTECLACPQSASFWAEPINLLDQIIRMCLIDLDPDSPHCFSECSYLFTFGRKGYCFV